MKRIKTVRRVSTRVLYSAALPTQAMQCTKFASGSDTQDTPCDRRESTGNWIPQSPEAHVGAAAKSMSRKDQFAEIRVLARIYQSTGSQFRLARARGALSTTSLRSCRY